MVESVEKWLLSFHFMQFQATRSDQSDRVESTLAKAVKCQSAKQPWYQILAAVLNSRRHSFTQDLLPVSTVGNQASSTLTHSFSLSLGLIHCRRSFSLYCRACFDIVSSVILLKRFFRFCLCSSLCCASTVFLFPWYGLNLVQPVRVLQCLAFLDIMLRIFC
jgi:hypothetical protein